MAVQNTFFWDGSQYYGEEELFCVWRIFFKPGVRKKDDGTVDFEVHTSSGNITVEGGIAYVDGAFRYEGSQRTFNCTGYGTNCSLVIRADYANKTCDLRIISGHTPVRNGTIYDLLLYQFTVSNGVVKILADKRLDDNYCGICRPRNTAEWDDKFSQIETRVESWFKNVQGRGWRQIYVQSGFPPTDSESSPEGSIFFDTGTGLAYKMQSGEWVEVRLMPDRLPMQLYGTAILNAGYTGRGSNILPFTNPDSARVYGRGERNTKFANYQSNGLARVDVEGFYIVSAQIHVSRANSNDTFQVGLFTKPWDPSTSGVYKIMIAENYGMVSGNNACSINVCGIRQLKKNDMVWCEISAYSKREQSNNVEYTIDFQNSSFMMFPLKILDTAFIG